MPFIKVQKLTCDESGKISSGSAAVVDTIYVPDGKYHSKQVIREKLGKVLYLSDDKRTGIFMSPTRGLVGYDSDKDIFSKIETDDERIAGLDLFMKTPMHTVFGDTYLILNLMKNIGMTAVLRKVFPENEEYERLLAHILHGILKDGSRIPCDLFIEKSFVSAFMDEITSSTLHSDSRFFTYMGKDETKVTFFREFVRMMRKAHKNFGKGCYVDSTPLPNDISDNPFNALSCHGVNSSNVQTRLVLVLDSDTGLPVWFDIIPGNLLDLSTIMNVLEDVNASLDITVDSMVLDAGYVSSDFLAVNNIDSENGKDIIARMPAKKGYPFKDLYNMDRPMFPNGKYAFVRNGHAYYGNRREVTIFGKREYAYVYVDKDNALNGFKQYMEKYSEEFEEMKDKDKTWMQYRFGYFVLISNKQEEPSKILDMYFSRTEIETVFKTAKEYLRLLPLSKWNDTTVRGKILNDIIDLIIYLEIRKIVNSSERSMTEVIGRTQSLMCLNKGNGTILVEQPNKQTKKAYDALGVKIPNHVDLTRFRSDIIML